MVSKIAKKLALAAMVGAIDGARRVVEFSMRILAFIHKGGLRGQRVLVKTQTDT